MLKRNKSYTPKKKKGQSTVEYIVLVAAIVSALIVFLGPSGVFKKAYSNTLESGTTGMEAMANALANSRFINQDGVAN